MMYVHAKQSANGKQHMIHLFTDNAAIAEGLSRDLRLTKVKGNVGMLVWFTTSPTLEGAEALAVGMGDFFPELKFATAKHGAATFRVDVVD